MESKNKDWTGNSTSVYKTLGSSSHTEEEREINDYYATDPRAMELLLELEQFNHNVWEPSCGENHLTDVLRKNGYNVKASDIVQRGKPVEIINFLTTNTKFDGDIITNPPYKFGKEFVEKSLDLINVGNRVAMFLKIQFMEGKGRKDLFVKNPPQIIYVSSSRLLCAKNGDFEEAKKIGGSAVAYAWYIWKKQNKYEKNYVTQLKWFN